MGNLTLLDGSQVKVVIKEAVDADANAYRLKPRELANVFRREAEMLDWTFAYWHAPFSASPAPRVILKWNGDRFVPCAELMAAAKPSDEQIDEEVTFFRTTGREAAAKAFGYGKFPFPDLWRRMLDLMYSGNVRAAWRLYDGSWQEGEEGKHEFEREFIVQLHTSPYWPDILKQLPKEEQGAMR